MNNISNLTKNIELLYKLNNELNLIELFDNLYISEIKYKEEIHRLENIIIDKNIILNDYENQIQLKNIEIEQYKQDMIAYSKVSYIVSMNKELTTQKNYIKILEGQLNKLKTNNINNNYVASELEKIQNSNNIDKENIIDDLDKHNIDEEPNLTIKKSKKKLNKENITDDLDQSNIDEKNITINNNLLNINGYDLIKYNKEYYLRDLETNEIYSITNNKPDIRIGLLYNNNKIEYFNLNK